MKKMPYRLLALAVCCVVLSMTVLAAGCSLKVRIEDDKRDPVPNLCVELCQVTNSDGTAHALTADFAALGLTVEELVREGTAEQAETVYQYILAQELTGTILLTDWTGTAHFTALEQGVYLVFERGGQVLSFSPYLVCLPTESEGELYYHLDSTPKTVSTDSRSIMVMKMWDDQDDAAGARPDHVKITLCRDGAAIRTVVLNEACRWQHTFTMLPGQGVYTVEETPVRNYAALCEEVAEGFLLTNTYAPSDDPEDPTEPDRPVRPAEPRPPEVPPEQPQLPQEPTLPQTGFQMWPVYLLLLLGTALVIWGLAEVLLSKEES